MQIKGYSDTDVKRISLEEEQFAFAGAGWMQERYYSSDGETVRDFLSFRSVYDINPFEVGRRCSKERAVYGARRRIIWRILDLERLGRKPVLSLSNGESRCVLLARKLLCESGDLVLDGGFGGMDAFWRGKTMQLARALRPTGVNLQVAGDVRGDISSRRKPVLKTGSRSAAKIKPVVEIRNLDLSIEGRNLFKNFSWTVREGEYWRLKGPNGSGKTMLLALVTGDSPFAYACDIKVFGVGRGESGAVLADLRDKIGSVSSVASAYGDLPPLKQLDGALRPGIRLLLLDEPCCNMQENEAEEFASRVESWLRKHPKVAAVWIEHDEGRIPPAFMLEMKIGKR